MYKGYYFITDSALSRHGNVFDVKAAVECEVKIVQYRNKTGNARDMYLEAAELKKLCWNTKFIVNDRIDIALAVEADGIHVGQDDIPYSVARKLIGKNKIVGVTVHSIEEAVQAEKSGADYIGVSPVYGTATKKDAGKPAGTKLIIEIKKVVKIPLVAIGGINFDNVKDVISAGADMVCSISAVITKEDVKSEILKFKELFK